MISKNSGLSPNIEQGVSVDDTVRLGPTMDDTVASEIRREQDAEIAKLTWAVLDGKATMEERTRLAELVNAQHQTRSA